MYYVVYEVLCEFFLNKLRKYGGASSFKLLKIIIFIIVNKNNCLNNCLNKDNY